MKLRLQGSTLRLRLRRSEIDRLAEHGEIEEVVRFGDASLTYSLVLDGQADTVRAEMHTNGIRVRLPRVQGLTWCHGGETAISSNEVSPTVLIERDFVRTAVEEPDDYDRFTNPRSGRKPPLRP
jgi:hypothetical protein